MCPAIIEIFPLFHKDEEEEKKIVLPLVLFFLKKKNDMFLSVTYAENVRVSLCACKRTQIFIVWI